MKNKVVLWSFIMTFLITVITVSLTFGRILERIDIVIVRLSRIETSLDRLHDHEKRIVILEEKIYNIEKGK